MPDVMRAALAGEQVRVRNPNSIRPWQHVLNPLSGYLVLAQALWDSPEHACGWNFGPPERRCPPGRLGRRAHRRAVAEPSCAGRSTTVPIPHEARYLKLDSSRARGTAGLAPAGRARRGAARHRRVVPSAADGADMRAVTLGQIEAIQYAAAAQ